MNTALHLPSDEETQQAKASSRVLAKYSHTKRLKITVCDPNNAQQDELIVPSYALNLLLDILAEMAKGNALTVIPIHAELTTQQAASILNVSRPHLIDLLEKNVLPYRKVGTHRRILAQYLFQYKQQLEQDRLRSLDELVQLSQELAMGYNE